MTQQGNVVYTSVQEICKKALTSNTAVGAVKLAREAGHAFARIHDKHDTPYSDLMSLLLHALISQPQIDDKERIEITRDVQTADVVVANCLISSKKSSTLSVCIQHVFISACARRVKN